MLEKQDGITPREAWDMRLDLGFIMQTRKPNEMREQGTDQNQL